ncbi:dehydrogenase/reductase SDR family member 12-like [Penaeus chinensis]|uniref:dehydrogenase/reductase SDR family member 12-like n=1 Tax=Penaeus chinensis TaxID=139456 RepID=UPI001FB80BD9|nr:dehydrogenase/reductase SDR family member 12-like [Penaeus chinensis]
MSMYRNTVWFLKGLKEYTKSGYEAASKGFKESDLEVDCTGKHYMITGANSGIGKCIATEIAKRGGTIHMVCRNPKTAEEAKGEITEASNNQNVHLHILDMSVLQDVYKFTQTFMEQHDQLHALVNNAGCMINTREVTDENLEKNFVTNTLSTHILTTNLIPLLKKSEKPRVVVVTSGGMLVQKLNVDDLQFEKMKPFDGTMAYAQNKRQQVVMTEQYAKQYPDVHFSCMHPGWADTPAVRNSMPDFYNKMKDKLRSPSQGADTAVWLAVSPAALEQQSGLFFQDRSPAATHLPLAWTKVCTKDEENFMTFLNELAAKFKA